MLPFTLAFAVAATRWRLRRARARVSWPLLDRVRRRVRWSPSGSSSRPAPATRCRRSSCSCRCCCCCRRRWCRCSSARQSRRPPADVARGRRPAPAACSRSATRWFALAPGAGARARPARRPPTGSTCRCTSPRSRPSSLVDVAAITPRALARRLGVAAAICSREMRIGQRVDVLLAPIGLLAALAAADAPLAALLVLAAVPAAARLRERARGADPAQPRARPRVPRHRAAAARPARGRRRVHRPPHRGRRRASRAGRRGDAARRGHAARDRDGRAAARHRQDRGARRDHQQARPARRRRVGDHEDPHDRGRADAPAGRRPALAASASSSAPRTSAGTAAATPTAWPARRSRSPPASSRPATPSTR